MTAQMTLFDSATEPDRIHDGPCATCAARRPADYDRAMFLEPVSLECHDCNHRTVAEILRGTRVGDRVLVESARMRHHRDATTGKGARR